MERKSYINKWKRKRYDYTKRYNKGDRINKNKKEEIAYIMKKQ